MPGLTELLAGIAVERAKALAASHDATRSGRKPKQPTKAVPTGTPDILGLFILMPHRPNGGAR
jgi:hypothetical protein